MNPKPRLYCDLSELYAGSLGRGGFYGIARVVAEIALELDGLVDGMGYVVFSATFQRFICVDLQRQQLLLGRPASFGFNLHRLVFALDQRCSRWLGTLPPALQAGCRNVLAWMATPWLSVSVEPLGPGMVFSAARPKFIARYARALDKHGLKLASLLHDFFPLLDSYDRPRQAFVDAFARDNRVVLGCSDVVIANSFFTRDCLLQLQESGQLPPHRQLAVAQLAHECRLPQGCESSRASFQPETSAIDQESPFFLAVGCRPGRKNLQLILEAWLLLHGWAMDAGHPTPLPQLVLAGAARGSIRRFLDQPRFAAISPAIRLVVSPSQAALIGLYQRATATLLPSFSEGWGLPASESLWFGTPVVVSDTPVMHEVCGDLGLYVDPDRAEEMALMVRRLCEHGGFCDSQRQLIAASRPSLRRWLETAQDVCLVMR